MLQKKTYFNTSYVSVKQGKRHLQFYPLKDFNTSYVSVKLFGKMLGELGYYFNTSYVSVKRKFGWFTSPTPTIFQYIICIG